MKILENLIERQTRRIFPEETNLKIPSVVVDLESYEKGEAEIQPLSFGILKEYELSLRVGVSFTANNAQYKRAKKDAINQLQYALYKDFIEGLLEARNCTPDNQTKELLADLLDIAGVEKIR